MDLVRLALDLHAVDGLRRARRAPAGRVAAILDHADQARRRRLVPLQKAERRDLDVPAARAASSIVVPRRDFDLAGCRSSSFGMMTSAVVASHLAIVTPTRAASGRPGGRCRSGCISPCRSGAGGRASSGSRRPGSAGRRACSRCSRR